MKWQIPIFTLLGLILANYLYQYFNEANYVTAFERSYFQVLAIGTVWLNHYLFKDM